MTRSSTSISCEHCSRGTSSASIDESAANASPGVEPEESSGGISNVVRRVFGGDTSAIQVKGHDDLLVYRARCCNPIRGEEIIGYVTRGKGVAVHSRSCTNVENLMYEPERRIAVEWGKDGTLGTAPVWQTGFVVKLVVLCDNRPGMLKQITAVISDTAAPVQAWLHRRGGKSAVRARLVSP